MRIAFVINDRFCPAGVVGDVVAESGHEIIELYPHEGDPVPTYIPDAWDGLMAFGGRMHAYEDETYPALADVARLIGDAHKAGLPYLGVCLGAQQLARALGEERVQMETGEFGIVPLALTDRGRTDPLLKGLDAPPVMQVHADSFNIPRGGELLVSDEMSAVQAVRVGPTSYGFQCHFEVTEADLTAWLKMLEEECCHLLNAEQTERLRATRAGFRTCLPAAQAFGSEVTRRWLDIAAHTRRVAPSTEA